MSVVNGVHFDEIVRAIRAIHDLAIPNEQRLYFTQAIENLKESNPFSSIDTAFYLIQQEDLPVQHVGWNIIEHIIRYKWLEIEPGLRLKIRNEVLDQISQGRYSLRPTDLPVKTAISRSIVFMMENEWPQNWPELFPQFQKIVDGPCPQLFPQCQMVFIVLRRLIEDVITLATIEDAAKRRDLSTAISAHMSDILNMCMSKLRDCISCSSERSDYSDSALLSKSIIELLSEIVEWVVSKVLEEFVDAIIDVLCAFLSVSEFEIDEDAIKCLEKLASRKNVKAQETRIVISMFRDLPMRAIFTAVNTVAESNRPSHYKYLKLLCNLLCALGIHLADVWTYLPADPPNFSLYIGFISAFFKHDSIYIRAEAAQVLSAFSAHEKISKNADFINCITSLFQHLPRCMEKSGVNLPQKLSDYNLYCNSMSKAAKLTLEYCRADYDSEDELLRDFLSLRERCCKIIRDNTVIHFDKLFSIIEEWIKFRFIMPTVNIDEDEFDMFKRFINTCLLVANQNNIVNEEVRKSLVSLFDIVFERFCTLNDAKTMNGTLSILSSFFQVFNDCPDRVPIMLNRFKLILALENTEGLTDNLTLKRHCIVLLLKIISSCPKAAKQYAGNILDLVVRVANNVTVMQRASLVHVLGALSNLAESPAEQHMFLQNATQQNIEYLKSQNYLTCISSATNLFAYIGLTSPHWQDNDLYYNNRLELRSHLSAIEGLLQQVNLSADNTNPLFPLLQSVIPSFFHLAGCLNSIYNPENTALIHSSYGTKVLDITSQEKQIIHFSMLETEIKEDTSNNNSTDPVTYTRRYLIEITELVQNIIGLVASKLTDQFYNSFTSGFDASELMCTTLCGIENVPDCRIRFWIRRAWCKLLCSCTPDKHQIVLKLLVALTRHFHQLIGNRWNVIRTRSEDESTEEELFFESVTSILCREYAGFLKNMIMGELPSHKGNTKDSFDLLNPLARELLRNKDVLDNIIVSLAKLINCSDTQAAVKAVPVANIVVGNFFTEFDEQIASFLLIQTIQSLQIHGPDDVILGPLLSLIFSIYSLLRPIYPSLMQILNQVPGSVPDTVLNFDNRVLTMMANKEKLVDKNKRDLMKKILKPVIALNIGEQHKRPVQLRRVT